MFYSHYIGIYRNYRDNVISLARHSHSIHIQYV